MDSGIYNPNGQKLKYIYLNVSYIYKNRPNAMSYKTGTLKG